MPGGVVRSGRDRVVETFPERNKIASGWGKVNTGQGVLVLNAFKDYPGPGLGDPTVDTDGSTAYYKWTGTAFTKISEGESLDQILNPTYNGAYPTTIAWGGIAAGSDLRGKTLTEIVQQASVVYQNPAFTNLAITGQATTIEVGASIEPGGKTVTWSASNGGNIKPNIISLRNQSLGGTLLKRADGVTDASGLANDGNEIINLLQAIQLNAPGATQIFRIVGENTNNVQFTRDLTITAAYRRFYGSLESAEISSVRELPGSTFGSSFSISIPQGRTVIAIAYEATRPDLSDSSVKYVEGFNSNVGSLFAKLAVSVPDAGGTERSYKLFIQTLGAPYPGAATYNVTIP